MVLSGTTLTEPSRIHIVGIGGAGMSGLALVLSAMGHHVSGSDLKESPVTLRLRQSGISVVVGHSAEALGTPDLVTASPAVPETNVELRIASERGIPVWTRAQVLGALTRLRETIAVSGTHGKTTTSTMLSLILIAAGMDPSFLIGADVVGIGANALWGKGNLLVLEADESYGSFDELSPRLALVTNIEADHLDHYDSLQDIESAFGSLVARSKDALGYVDDPGVRRVSESHRIESVGQGNDYDYAISDIALARVTSSFVLRSSSGQVVHANVGAPGLHNVVNAALAVAGALKVGVGPRACEEGLSRFAGVPRRYEFRGSAATVTFVDDYAHLPGEVHATVRAAQAGGFARVVAVFQPHRYSRIAALASSFAGAFDGADAVVITDIYGAGEAPVPGVTGELVVKAISSRKESPKVYYAANRDDLISTLATVLSPGDLCLTMGAGDLTTLADTLIEVLRR